MNRLFFFFLQRLGSKRDAGGWGKELLQRYLSFQQTTRKERGEIHVKSFECSRGREARGGNAVGSNAD